MTTRLDLEWEILASLLPVGWRELARETGAIRRRRGELQEPTVLLQVLLLHVATGLSLKQAAARATTQGLATLTDVALLKRLRSSEGFLQELSRRMFLQSRFSEQQLPILPGHRLRAVDATTVQEPGSTGTDWRVHYSISLPAMGCDFYEITDDKGGESYLRIPVQSGDVLLADRGYCHREGVAEVLKQGGDVIVRLSTSSFPLLDAQDFSDVVLLPKLRRLTGHTPSDWEVCFAAQQTLWFARLCAVRKTPAAAERAKQKLLRDATRKGRTLLPQTLEAAEYLFVLTTLPAHEASAAQVLELYRARWQIELCFKRLKSLLRLGHVPKRSDVSARAFIQGKLLAALLIERLLLQARFFSPWGIRPRKGAATGVSSSKFATLSSPSLVAPYCPPSSSSTLQTSAPASPIPPEPAPHVSNSYPLSSDS